MTSAAAQTAARVSRLALPFTPALPSFITSRVSASADLPSDHAPHVRTATTLYRLARLATSADGATAALSVALRELVATFGADAGSIALLDANGSVLRTDVQIGQPAHSAPFELKSGHGVTGWCVANAKPLLVPEVASEPRYISARPATQCEMAAPLGEGDEVIGAIDLESDRPRAFNADDLALLTLAAAELTRVIRHLWRQHAFEQKARQLESLITIGRSLVTKLEPQELFDTVVGDARQILQARACMFQRHDAATDRLRLTAFAGDPGAAPSQTEADASACLAAAALRTQKQIEHLDVQTPGFDTLADLPTTPLVRSVLLTPVAYEGEIFGVLSIFTDRVHRFTNDEKRLAAALASLAAVALQNTRLYARVFQSEATLRKNEQLTTLGLLAAEIAHEIRNPLTVLKLLYGQLGIEFPSDDPRHTDLRVIGEKLDQLEAIVSRVLNFAKAPARLHSLWPLADIVTDTLVLVRLKLAQAKIQIRFEAPPGPLLVDAHKGQLQQVLLNLILNATHAMPAGGEIALRLTGDPAAQPPLATLDLRDTGSGIPAEIRDRIFDSFLSGRSGGTGLGLAIARRIMLDHHGDVTLLETGPAGTTLRLTLPLAKPAGD
ncbi:GAF domain-containing protein [Horticoccus luteus]|uniref:histidine kinase n=1 Tax=Horticoccus luteus TaxID=2862869 RepID=A0A8F9TTM1_9BACT|nr:GAF domain-containing protein [Horticoccus luteus]QYM77826.1 GAF domain-containing protein [Horticoccus luteus]